MPDEQRRANLGIPDGLSLEEELVYIRRAQVRLDALSKRDLPASQPLRSTEEPEGKPSPHVPQGL